VEVGGGGGSVWWGGGQKVVFGSIYLLARNTYSLLKYTKKFTSLKHKPFILLLKLYTAAVRPAKHQQHTAHCTFT
jgi:hypothetical protein